MYDSIGVTWGGGARGDKGLPPIVFNLGIVYLVTEMNDGK
jgi:hypothetical protein